MKAVFSTDSGWTWICQYPDARSRVLKWRDFPSWSSKSSILRSGYRSGLVNCVKCPVVNAEPMTPVFLADHHYRARPGTAGGTNHARLLHVLQLLRHLLPYDEGHPTRGLSTRCCIAGIYVHLYPLSLPSLPWLDAESFVMFSQEGTKTFRLIRVLRS